MRVRLLVLCLLGCMLALAAASPALASDRDCRCHRVNATGTGETRDGNTTATFTGHPLLRGTGTGHIVVGGGQPPVLPMTTDIVFTTRFGTFRADTTGTLNVATGAFTSTGPVSAGTGTYTGATGSLTFTGVADFATGRFKEKVRGVICLARRTNDGG